MMSIESTTTDPNWGSLQGTMLEGGYELTEILGADAGTATFKLRVLGDYSRKALVKLFRAQGDAADQQLSMWEAVRSLRHPNLSGPMATGRTQIDGIELIYVILSRPDENLAGVLRERALTEAEAGEVLLSLTRALEQLHANGFVHGCVSPEQVLAIGDSILLSTDCVRRINAQPPLEITKPKCVAPEQSGENITPAADVWCLGATIFQALTQKECSFNCAQEAEKLPGAFGRVLPRCLDADPQARCKISEIPNLYKTAPAPVREMKAAAAAAAAKRSAPGMTTRVRESSAASRPRVVPALDQTRGPRPKPIVVPPRRRPGDSDERKQRAWIYIAVAALAVLLFIWLAHPHRRATVGPVPAPPQDTSGKAWPTQTLSPDGTAATTRPAPPPAVASTAPHGRSAPQAATRPPAQQTANAGAGASQAHGQIWRVVLYTYNHEQDAQKMAQTLNQKYAGLGAEVFSPKGGSPYLVVIGGEMDRDEAVKTRRKAIGLGLPRDSYIQNYRK